MHSNLFANLLPMMPELYLAAASCVMLLFGVYKLKRVTHWLILATILILALTMGLESQLSPERITVMNGMFVSDGFTAFAKMLILGSGILVLMLSSGWLTADGGRPMEYLLLVLFATLGMLLMVSSGSLLALYMGLELSSLALYVLAAFDRDNTKSTEAGLKYFVLSALASGMLLFGISLIYGFTGTIGFDQLTELLSRYGDEGMGEVSRAVVVGMVFVMVGFCFKIAAVPFHMWSPDVYEGAPTPVTAFFSTAPKIAALLLFTRLMLQPFADLLVQWQQIIIFISVASMLVGALAALRQTNIKRLLAYSSIGHVGFMLMGLATGTASGVQGMLVYLTLYIFMSAGAFGCVLLMKRDGVYVEQISDLSGASRHAPYLAFALAAFMFSMAGIPPLGGFFGKFYVVQAAVENGLIPLAIIGLVTSVISCYYYLRVVKFMYFDEPHPAFDRRVPPAMRIGLTLCTLVTLLFFIIPGPLVAHARAVASLLLKVV